MKILTHLHLYYQKQLPYMLSQLKNLENYDWDLIVTISEDNEKIKQEILKFKPNAKILLTENEGYDVYPFIKVLECVDLAKYDYIIKIHTKNKRTGVIRQLAYTGNDWRNALISAVLGSKQKVKENIEIFENNPNIGMIGYDKLVVDIDEEAPRNFLKTNEVLKKLNINERTGEFVAGTMFMVRASLMQKIKDLHFSLEDFKPNSINKTKDTGSLAHALETILGVIVSHSGFEFKKVSGKRPTKFCIAKIKDNTRNKRVLYLFGLKIKYKKFSKKKIVEKMLEKQKISVVINTYNAERMLETTLKSVQKADEIIICDMYSTDKTIEIAEKFGCKVYFHEKLSQPDPARNFALSKATGDWILILDADEVISKELFEKLVEYANCPYKDYYVLDLAFKTYFMDGFLKCLEPEYHLRFFKKGHLKYSNGQIHVAPFAVASKILTLKPDKFDFYIYHFTVQNIQSMLDKQSIYTTSELEKIDFSKKKIRPSVLKMFRIYFSAFLKYFSKGAYKDGLRGFVWIIYNAVYKSTTYLKMLEKANKYEQKQEEYAKNIKISSKNL